MWWGPKTLLMFAARQLQLRMLGPFDARDSCQVRIEPRNPPPDINFREWDGLMRLCFGHALIRPPTPHLGPGPQRHYKRTTHGNPGAKTKHLGAFSAKSRRWLCWKTTGVHGAAHCRVPAKPSGSALMKGRVRLAGGHYTREWRATSQALRLQALLQTLTWQSHSRMNRR